MVTINETIIINKITVQEEVKTPTRIGVDGISPHIGDNGNWWIGEEDTGVAASGGGTGVAPHIGENGNWFIGATDTGVKAAGTDGIDGTNGADGVTPSIGGNKNWWIGDVDTGICAEGVDGQDGANGLNGITPHIGENENWWIGETDTGIQAIGADGTDGDNGKSAYQSYLDTTTDNPPLSEAEWANIYAIKADKTYVDETFQPKYVGSALTALFVSRGAVYNTTTGFYELNGLTNLTEAQMIDVYNVSSSWGATASYEKRFEGFTARTFFPPLATFLASLGSTVPSFTNIFRDCANAEAISFIPTNKDSLFEFQVNNGSTMFYGCSSLKQIFGIINVTGITNASLRVDFYNCLALESVRIKNLKTNIQFRESPNLTNASILYMIVNNAVASGTITITLHVTAYNRAMSDPEILAALQTYNKVALGT